jgi:hypothetical protein
MPSCGSTTKWGPAWQTFEGGGLLTAPPCGCRVLLQGKTAWEAVTEPRMHHQLFPAKLFFENYTFGNITLALPLATQQLLESKVRPVARLCPCAVQQ